MRILITSGATREPLDAVRFISNVSTGGTGAFLADAFQESGHSVTYLHGIGARLPKNGSAIRAFSSVESLEQLLIAELSSHDWDWVIHLAAVSDFTPVTVLSGKFDSRSTEEWNLRLKRTPKLLPMIREWSGNQARVTGFKLTHGAHEVDQIAAVAQALSTGGVDEVVANDLAEMHPEKGIHPFRLFRRDANGIPSEILRGTTLGELVNYWIKESQS